MRHTFADVRFPVPGLRERQKSAVKELSCSNRIELAFLFPSLRFFTIKAGSEICGLGNWKCYSETVRNGLHLSSMTTRPRLSSLNLPA
jgi:hypothetical protein